MKEKTKKLIRRQAHKIRLLELEIDELRESAGLKIKNLLHNYDEIQGKYERQVERETGYIEEVRRLRTANALLPTKILGAVTDPGEYTPQKKGETIAQWRARAVTIAHGITKPLDESAKQP